MKNIYIPDEFFTNENFTSTETMTRIIGTNLKRARLRRGLSLDEVSTRSTVSKSMLSDIERGRKCPTVAVLHKICDGIHVALPSLLREPEKFVEVVHNKELVQRGGFEVQDLFQYDTNSSIEIQKLRIAPNSEIQAAAHGESIWEYLMVIDGTFTLILDEEDAYEIGKGEAIRFLANRKHTYVNRTDKEVLMFNIIYYGG